MAKSVNGAFDEFRRDYVDLGPDKVYAARASSRERGFCN